MTTGDERAHLAAGAALTLAGVISAAAATVAGRRNRAAHALTAAGLGWLALRHAAVSQRLARAEANTGAWRTQEPTEAQRAAQRPPRPGPMVPPAEPAAPGARRRARDMRAPD